MGFGLHIVVFQIFEIFVIDFMRALNPSSERD